MSVNNCDGIKYLISDLFNNMMLTRKCHAKINTKGLISAATAIVILASLVQMSVPLRDAAAQEGTGGGSGVNYIAFTDRGGYFKFEIPNNWTVRNLPDGTHVYCPSDGCDSVQLRLIAYSSVNGQPSDIVNALIKRDAANGLHFDSVQQTDVSDYTIAYKSTYTIIGQNNQQIGSGIAFYTLGGGNLWREDILVANNPDPNDTAELIHAAKSMRIEDPTLAAKSAINTQNYCTSMTIINNMNVGPKTTETWDSTCQVWRPTP